MAISLLHAPPSFEGAVRIVVQSLWRLWRKKNFRMIGDKLSPTGCYEIVTNPGADTDFAFYTNRRND
jgi:hypothetical protein